MALANKEVTMRVVIKVYHWEGKSKSDLNELISSARYILSMKPCRACEGKKVSQARASNPGLQPPKGTFPCVTVLCYQLHQPGY